MNGYDKANANRVSGDGQAVASPPVISLPKGGGAIRGMGEKFAANPVTGTGSMSVPIATSPGRSGFGPQLSLAYDSGAGNGPFGFGWSLSLPAITRKTDKGLPRYQDADESDVFILSGAEDLVPVFKTDPGTGEFVRDAEGNFVYDELPRDGYVVRRYRPRIEGLFARIERWTRQSDGHVHWRSISKDNITTFYGKTEESRIANLHDPSQIFSWLICQSYDKKGNAIVYKNKEENSDGVDLAQVHEKNRASSTRSANRYLKRILYGNRTPNRDADWTATDPAQLPDSTWMFEVVFDYEDGHYEKQQPDADQRIFAKATIDVPPNSSWPPRQDPFSSYRAGFEVRTYRLCQRVLNTIGWLSLLVTPFFFGCTPPAYKPMDIAAFNQNTGQWKLDYNLFPLNPNWHYKLVNGKAPWTGAQCPLSDSPADWKNSPTCTSQSLHFNNGQIGCTNVFNRHGGHMNWFPVTEVGIVNFSDHSNDDDYNFYLQNPDSSLYSASDDPDPMNQNIALEFDSDEFPDPVDDDYDIWWNRFRQAVHDGDSLFGTDDYSEAQAVAKNKLAIVTGMAGIDLGHDYPNTWTTELHPVFGMFILTDEQTSINPDGSVAMSDTWSFFVRTIGDEGYCGTSIENAGQKQIKVFIPEMPYYYASTISPYQADARDFVTIDDGNVHITNWNGITDDNDPRRERWTNQTVNGGVILNFNFDWQYSEAIFVGDIKFNWTVHISFNGTGALQKMNTFVDESKFKENFEGLFNSSRSPKRKYETKDDSLLALRLSKLSKQEKMELHQALDGEVIIPGMRRLEPIPKGRSIKIRGVAAGKDSINTQEFSAQLKRMKIGDMSKQYSNVVTSTKPNQSQYVQRKSLKREFIDAYLKSKHL